MRKSEVLAVINAYQNWANEFYRIDDNDLNLITAAANNDMVKQ